MNEATFNQKLSSIMKDNMFDRFVSNRKTGKLDTRHLSKISYSDSVFKRKEERMNKNYAVSVLVDCSGSMTHHSGKYKYAAVCAATLANSFRQIPTINFEIYGFNSWGTEIKGFNKPLPRLSYIRDKLMTLTGRNPGTISNEEEERDVYGFLYNDTIYPNYQNVIPKDEVDELKISYLPRVYGAGENYDGLIINEMRHRINGTVGKKICIMLSDGRPTPNGYFVWNRPGKRNDEFDIMKEVKCAIEDGITFISIGVMDDHVRSVYPERNVSVIEQMEDLYPVIIDKLSKLIKRG